VSYGYPTINFCNPGVHYETPCIYYSRKSCPISVYYISSTNLLSFVAWRYVLHIEITSDICISKVTWSRYRPGVAQRVGRGIALLFHDRGTKRGWVVSSTPRTDFTPGKDPIPIVQQARWTPAPVWTGGKSRPYRDSIPDRPAHSQSLYRRNYPANTYTHVCMCEWKLQSFTSLFLIKLKILCTYEPLFLNASYWTPT